MEKRACLMSSSDQEEIKDGHQLVDRFSELSDEILIKIVSLLPLKEAGATSTLSRRWLYVWTSSKKLNFDADETVRRYYFNHNQELRDQESSKYVDWVNHVVEQHREQYDLEQFRICFLDLDKRFTSSIDKWILFAMKKRVQVLVLDCVAIVRGGEKYTITNYLKSSPEYLSFKSLKVLHLDSVNMTGGVLERMLRNCPYLEQVSMYYVSDLVELSVVGPTIALKHLEIRTCWDIIRIQIRDANLVSLSYTGKLIELDLSNVPFLIKANIYYIGKIFITPAFTHLSCCINQLQTLMLDIPILCQVNHYLYSSFLGKQWKIPVLPNLKNFKARIWADSSLTISMVPALMKAFPNLERLVLKLECTTVFQRKGEERILRELEGSSPFARKGENWLKEQGRSEKCPHPNIKVVEILGYRRILIVVELVSYIVKNLVALEKIVIDPERSWAFQGTRADKGVQEIKLEEEARDHDMRFITKELPSSVEFVCL